MAGLALLPTAAVTMVAVGLAGRLAPRYGNRRLMLLWLCLAAMGLALWAVTGSGSPYLVLAVRSAVIAQVGERGLQLGPVLVHLLAVVVGLPKAGCEQGNITEMPRQAVEVQQRPLNLDACDLFICRFQRTIVRVQMPEIPFRWRLACSSPVDESPPRRGLNEVAGMRFTVGHNPSACVGGPAG